MKRNIAFILVLLLTVSLLGACAPGMGSLVTFGNLFRANYATAGNVATTGNVPCVPTNGNVVTSGNAEVKVAIGSAAAAVDKALSGLDVTDKKLVEHPDGAQEVTFTLGEAKYSLSIRGAKKTEGTMPSGTWDVTKEENADGALYGIGLMNDKTSGQAVWTDAKTGLFYTLTQSGSVTEESLTQIASQLLGFGSAK